MGGILEAARVNVNLNRFIIGGLPTKVGDVSVMTLGRLYSALGGLTRFTGPQEAPSEGYNSSAYYVYGIAGAHGDNSISENLQAVGLDWYRQKIKPTLPNQTFTINGQIVFGGPLSYIYRYDNDTYDFGWYCSESDTEDSSVSSYWDGGQVSHFTEVIIVRAIDVIPSKAKDKTEGIHLPKKSGEVSILAIDAVYAMLGDSTNSTGHKEDPTQGYDTSTYYVYGIDGEDGFDSTFDNLFEIGFDWFLQKNKPTESHQIFNFKGKELFGGPLSNIYRGKDNSYTFSWYYSGSNTDESIARPYWNNDVSDSVYVAIVHR